MPAVKVDQGAARAPRFCVPYAPAMLIYSMSVTADGFINDRNGGIDWTSPSDELFEFHLDRVRGLGGHIIGRKLYETMLVWETDLSLRQTPLFAEFAAVWTALPKVVFSRTLTSVQGNARLAKASLADEIKTVLASTDKDVEIGGAGLAAQAFEQGSIDDVRLFRIPIVLGAGTPFLAPLDRSTPLELVESRVFEPGIVYEHYRVSPATAPTS
jgi:dihydrofolate reductase